MNIDEKAGTTVMHQTPEYKPPRSWRTVLFGKPIPTTLAAHESIGKAIGLAVFAADALSSTAYATQEMLVILILAGTSALHVSIPISFAIVGLLVVVATSYVQTIFAYPGGGGAYIVSRDNLGEIPALLAAASLLTDYILTVSVSVSSGVAQIISAYPDLFPFRVLISISMVLLVTLINLRGVRESGLIFAIPSYFFVAIMFVMVSVGLFRAITGTLHPVSNPPEYELIEAMQPLSFLLILRAFSNGTSALTGTEAISNGIMVFKNPRSRNAAITLIWMACILGVLMLGVSFLSANILAVPSEHETVISQLARTIFGSRNILYMMVIYATTIILILAANTAFAGFPRLSALTAADGFLPRQLNILGDRLVFTRGIVALGVIASVLIAIFQGSVTKLIPLYAIGVFLSFTLSQTGMARRWWKSGKMKIGDEIVERGSTLRYDKNWRLKMIVNGFGALCTAVVALVFGYTKFKDGAWIVIVVIPILVTIFETIHRHYKGVARSLSLSTFVEKPYITRHRVILTVGGVHAGTLAALRYARTLSNDITAVHVSIDSAETEKIQKKWELWGQGIRLVILDSQYRLVLGPMLEYIDQIEKIIQPNETITIVVPQFIPKKRWANFLHTRTADILRKELLNREEIVITEVPYQI